MATLLGWNAYFPGVAYLPFRASYSVVVSNSPFAGPPTNIAKMSSAGLPTQKRGSCFTAGSIGVCNVGFAAEVTGARLAHFFGVAAVISNAIAAILKMANNSGSRFM